MNIKKSLESPIFSLKDLFKASPNIKKDISLNLALPCSSSLPEIRHGQTTTSVQ